MYKQVSQVSETITYPSTLVTTSTVVKADIFSLLGGLGLVTALPIGVAIAWITLRPSFLVPRTNEAYVVRGARGTVVLLDGGQLLIGTRRITNVTLNEVEVKVEKHGKNDEAVRTMDSLKANIAVVFHVGVKKDAESIKLAASRLAKNEVVGEKEIKEAVNARADDCIRGAAKNLTLDDIDMKKKHFEEQVRAAISEDLAKNGLEVLSVSVSEITEADNYNPSDFLDAQGLEKRTAATETAKQQTFALQQATVLKLKEQELQTERQQLELESSAAVERFRCKEEVRKSEYQAEAKIKSEESVQSAIAAGAKAQSEVRIAQARQMTLEAQTAVVLQEEKLKTIQLTEQANREKTLAELKAAEEAAVKTAGLVAQAEASAKADLAAAMASVQVASARAESLQITAEAEKRSAIAKAEGIKAIVEAQNAATTTAIFAQFIEKHGQLVVERLPSILEAMSPQAGVLGNPTIISSGQGDNFGGMLFNTSAVGIMKFLLQDEALSVLFKKFVGGETERGSKPPVIPLEKSRTNMDSLQNTKTSDTNQITNNKAILTGQDFMNPQPSVIINEGSQGQKDGANLVNK